MNRRPVLIIGHKNPDLDSVASAIAYEQLKKLTGDTGVLAATCGEINRETQFVLNKLEIMIPPVVSDVKARVEDLIDETQAKGYPPKTTVHEAGHIIRDRGQKTLPIVDNNNVLVGLITVGDLAMTFMDHLGNQRDPEKAGKEVQRILETPLSELMKTDNLIIFDCADAVEEVRQMMLKTRYRNYPVTDEENRFLGLISRYNLLSMKRKQVILVDHNEKKQAIDGIEEADILEIIDHHRLGDLQSITPIYFRNEPVGATSTLIAESYREKELIPEKAAAGLLLAGILSDTMIYRSPTTTERDRSIAEWLSQISGLNVEEWGREIFVEASALDKKDPLAMVTEDLKEYSYGDLDFAIAQFETADKSILLSMMDTLRLAMINVCSSRGYDLMFLMITDIFVEGSELLIAGAKTETGAKIFGDATQVRFSLDGVMSRKKQLVPTIYKALARQEMM